MTSTKPIIVAPDLPTAVSAGFPGIANQSSYGLLAPAGTPKPIIDQVAKASKTLLSTAEYQKLMLDMGQALRLSLILAPAMEAPQGDPELEQPLEVLSGKPVHRHLPHVHAVFPPETTRPFRCPPEPAR